MRLHSHSAPAVSALALVLCTVAFTFVVFMLMAAPMPVPRHSALMMMYAWPVAHNIPQVVAMVLGLAYAAGIIGWGIVFALHRSGMHRLASMQTVITQPRILR